MLLSELKEKLDEALLKLKGVRCGREGESDRHDLITDIANEAIIDILRDQDKDSKTSFHCTAMWAVIDTTDTRNNRDYDPTLNRQVMHYNIDWQQDKRYDEYRCVGRILGVRMELDIPDMEISDVPVYLDEQHRLQELSRGEEMIAEAQKQLAEAIAYRDKFVRKGVQEKNKPVAHEFTTNTEKSVPFPLMSDISKNIPLAMDTTENGTQVIVTRKDWENEDIDGDKIPIYQRAYGKKGKVVGYNPLCDYYEVEMENGDVLELDVDEFQRAED